MVILSNFADRLKEQMILRDLKAPALAQIIGVSRATVAGFLRGAHFPSPKAFFALLEYFNCSADYLLGLIDFPSENVVYHKPIEKFGQTFRELLKTHRVSQFRLEQDLPVSGNLVYRWLNDLAFPSVESMVKLADFLEISVDMLIGRVK